MEGMLKKLLLLVASVMMVGGITLFSLQRNNDKQCPQCPQCSHTPQCHQCPTCKEAKDCPQCPQCPQCPLCEKSEENSSLSVDSKGCPVYHPEPPPKNFTFLPPIYFQDFPIERYPGLKCYVIVSERRHLVLTQNCNPIHIDSENITIGSYVIPRQAAHKVCERCYSSDYLNILSLLLFGKLDEGVEPFAPKGVVIFEDDAVACNSALDVLDDCFKEQMNCCLGYGAWMNFYAGPKTKQPHPELYAQKRFNSVSEIFHPVVTMNQDHADWMIRVIGRVGKETDYVNHLGYTSVLQHPHDDWDVVFKLRCPMNESLAGGKKILHRTKDIGTHRMGN